jgi:hypothetical protein
MRFVPVDPFYASIEAWADETVGMLYNLSAVPRLDAPGEWIGWATDLIGLPAIAAYNPPDPKTFDDWREWAMRFNEAMTSRSGT